jgi:CheY-like chemotaxis protein
VLAEMVEARGVRPALASNADAALREIEAAARNNAAFRLILLDSKMPGTDGFALAAEIRQRTPSAETALVIMISMNEHRRAAGCREMGIAAYVSKPVSASQLWGAIRLALDPARPSLATLPERTARPPSAGPDLPNIPPLRILLAEDNPVNQMVAGRLLQNHGHLVQLAANGYEALAALEASPFDLVLMDAQMPVMDGFEAARAIREKEKLRGGHVPIIALTAHVMSGDRERCVSAGMDGYASKPIRAEDLFREIERVRSIGASPVVAGP